MLWGVVTGRKPAVCIYIYIYTHTAYIYVYSTFFGCGCSTGEKEFIDPPGCRLQMRLKSEAINLSAYIRRIKTINFQPDLKYCNQDSDQ
jgi:hypothetical protein